MMQADATDMFGGDWEQIDLGPGAGAGRPGQVIRLHPTTRQRHLDWLDLGPDAGFDGGRSSRAADPKSDIRSLSRNIGSFTGGTNPLWM